MAATIANLAALNKHMATRSYITGYTMTKNDSDVFEKLGAEALASSSSAPHAYRWAVSFEPTSLKTMMSDKTSFTLVNLYDPLFAFYSFTLY